MKSRQLMFFAVLEDIEPVIKDIESSIDIRYYNAGLQLFDSESIPAYDSILDIPNIGITFSGDWNRIDNYLVIKKKEQLIVRKIPQRTGEIKFSVDQMNNLKSIELKLGGIYQEKENVIVAGRIATISEDEESKELYNLFSTKIRKEFKIIGAFYVGKKAKEKLMLGWRLVTNEKSPREYDLVYK